MFVKIKDVHVMAHLKNFVFEIKRMPTKNAPVSCRVVAHSAFTLRNYRMGLRHGYSPTSSGYSSFCDCVTHFKKNEIVGAVYNILSDNLIITE